MKSTLDKLAGLNRKLTVEIPLEQVQEAFEKAYRAIQKKANIKGFRPGKAPLKTIKSIYGEEVTKDVLNDLVNSGYQAALDEHNLDPVGYPKLSFEPLNEDKPFTFVAEFEVRPEISLQKYEGLPVQKEKIEIPEEQIQRVLENLRGHQAEFVPVFEDRGLAVGDVAEIDFTGYLNDQPLPNGSAQGHLLEIGSKQFIEGFEDGLVGMKIGETRTLNLMFPANYHEPSLSGQPVRFETKLLNIKKKVLPELNDELAKKVGQFETLEELKAQIRKDLEENEIRRIEEDLKNRIVKALVDSNPVEAPRGLVEQQRKALEEDFRGRLKQQGLQDSDFEEYKQKWAKDFEESAEFMVKSTFLLDALADRLNLRAGASDIQNKIDEYARQTGIERARIEEFYSQPERRSRLGFQLTEEKVIRYLLEKAQVTEVPRSQLAGN